MIGKLLLASSLTLLLSGAGWAASTASQAVTEAQAAAAQLRAAVGKLDSALSADDQVVALTDVVRGYEQGLGALRQGLRQASAREIELRARFESQREKLSRVLGAMTALQQSPETALLLHPDGALASAQSSMILADVTPGLREEAQALQADLDEITMVRELQASAANMLQGGLATVQEARRLLVSAASDRSSMPVRFGEAPAELQQLKDAAQSLDEFAKGVDALETDVGPPMDDFAGAQGSLPLPVVGTVLRQFQEADAAGVQRPGWVIATPPAALVTTPWSATIRYRGPLLDYGNVMIVEPAKDYLLIFAGMSSVFGEVGDVLNAGDPIGLMGGSEAPAQEFGAQFVANASKGGDAGRSETLYMELRGSGDPLDPADWFATNPVADTAVE